MHNNFVISLVILIFIFIFCGVAISKLLRYLSKDLDFSGITMFIKKLLKSK